MSIEEMLKAGKKPEEMMKEMHDQILEAQEKIRKEAAAKCNCDCEEEKITRERARAQLARAIARYLSTYEIELDAEDLQELENLIVEMEEEFKSMSGLLKLMFGDIEARFAKDKDNSKEKNRTTDDIINDFLRKMM